MKVRTYHDISFDRMGVTVEWEVVRQTLLWNYWEGRLVTEIPVLDMSLTKRKARTFRWSNQIPKVTYNAETTYLCDYKGHNLIAERLQEILRMKESNL